jgi:hypothetical protein
MSSLAHAIAAQTEPLRCYLLRTSTVYFDGIVSYVIFSHSIYLFLIIVFYGYVLRSSSVG